MKDYIQKTPSFLIYLSVFLTPVCHLLFTIFLPEVNPFHVLLIVVPVQLILVSLWFVSMISFFSEMARTTQNNVLIYGIYFTVILVYGFGILTKREEITSVLAVVLCVINAILILPKVKRVFYARSKSFIFVEVAFLPIGILTLTSEIKRGEVN